MQNLDAIGAAIETAITEAQTPAQLEAVRIAELGKKGRLTQMMRQLGDMSPQDRREAGLALNQLKSRISDKIAQCQLDLADAALEQRLASEQMDMSLPPRPESIGALHPVMQVFEEVSAIFSSMGFTRADGPDIEDDFHNFTALNFPQDHPARQEQDTFFMAGDKGDLLRTHTSPVQIRTMRLQKPPLRLIAPGRVYRRDWDATHTPMFHQIEGLVIDESTHMGHLKSCLTQFLERFFRRPVQTRFRPHFFPFTEPSAEMDVRCERDGGKLLVGTGPDWLEILGCGMVHPNVLSACGLDPKQYQGFAFGVGIDRLAMLKYGMPDLRPFFEGDTQWTDHYGFSPFDPVH